MSVQAAPNQYRPRPTDPPTPTGQRAPAPLSFWSRLRRIRWTEFRLLLVPALLSIVGMIMVIIVPTGAVQWEWKDLWMSFLFIGLFYAVHAWLHFTRPNADQVLLPLIAILTAIGLVMVQRLEPPLAAVFPTFEGIARKQVIWIVLGIIALIATVWILRDINWLRRYKYTFAL